MHKALLASLLAVSSLFLARGAHAGECAVEARPGVTDDDRTAVDEVLCSRLRENAPGDHSVRVAKLGSKMIVTVFSRSGSGPSEHQVILENIEELSVAAPRLVSAAAEQKPLGETLQVDNVLGQDARVPKKRPAEMHGWLSLVGVGVPSLGVGPGVALALSGGNERWSFIADGRVAAIGVGGSEETPTMFLQLSGGARYHLLSGDTSPFLGAGVSVLYLDKPGASGSRVIVNGRDVSSDKDGHAGLGGGIEAGLDVLRTNTVGGALVLRADLPAFRASRDASVGTPIVSGGLAMRF